VCPERLGEVFNERAEETLSGLVDRSLEDTPERSPFIERLEEALHPVWRSSKITIAAPKNRVSVYP
jgi:hypothetical protein